MQFYLAPMEGITNYIFRNAVEEFYPGSVDRFYAPFIVPHEKIGMSEKDRRELCPERNPGICLIPQILTNRAKDFCSLSAQLKEEYGYQMVNLNLGCPSKTVTSKGRGAGFLAKPEELDHFLEEVFSHNEVEVSIKTRLGMRDAQEFEQLMEIYNRYPIRELIIHPRVQADYYNNTVNMEAYILAAENADMPLCFNGDIASVADFDRKMEILKTSQKAADKTQAIMLGRGMVENPALIGLIRSSLQDETRGQEWQRLFAFLQKVLHEYSEILSGDRDVLFRMKEIWSYMNRLFPDSEKAWKAIRKAQHLTEYDSAVNEIFRGKF